MNLHTQLRVQQEQESSVVVTWETPPPWLTAFVGDLNKSKAKQTGDLRLFRKMGEKKGKRWQHRHLKDRIMCPHKLAEQNQGGGAENDDIPSTKRNAAGEVVEPGRRCRLRTCRESTEGTASGSKGKGT
jgi:hypothetical protein